MRPYGSISCLAAMLLLSAVTAAAAQEATEPHSLEYRIEIGQHEQLVKTRTSETDKGNLPSILPPTPCPSRAERTRT
jgi:hypothetical protein